MSMGRAQQLDVKQPVDSRIERERRCALHDARARGRRDAAAERFTGDCVLDVLDVVQRVADRAIAGAAADVYFQRGAEVTLLRLADVGTGQNHASSAEAALKP